MDERELHGLMKLWRHGRATRTIGQVLQDSYVMLFSVVMIGAMLISVVLRAQGNMAGCNTEACASGRLLVPTAMVLACFAVALGVARLFGPVLASAAEGFWLMDAPISRRRLLRGRLVLPLLLSFLIAGLTTALVGALSGLAWLQVLAWSCAAAFGSAGLVAFAASEQTRERVRVVKVLQAVFATAALAVLLVVVSVAAGWLPTAILAEADWPVKVIILTTFDPDEYVYRALQAGASGFILKDIPPEQLAPAVRTVADGGALLDPTITRRLIGRFTATLAADTVAAKRLETLSDREREVLVELAKGASNAEICDSLYIGAATVKTHVSAILTKLGLRDRAQAVVFAYESGLITPGHQDIGY